MAKGKNGPDSNDYLEQLEWKAQHRRHVPLRFEPKWKYKIVYKSPSTKFDRLFGAIGLSIVGILIFVLAKPISEIKITREDLPAIIISGGIGLLFLTIIFFALRDGAKYKDKEDDDSKHIDS